MIAGQLRIFAPALLVWAVTAWAIAHPGLPQAIFVSSCTLAMLLMAGIIPRKTRKHARTFMSVTVVLLTSLILITPHISEGHRVRESPNSVASDASPSRGELSLTLTSFPVPVSDQYAQNEAERFTFTAQSHGIPVRVWAEGSLESTLVPGSRVRVEGPITHQEMTSTEAFSITGPVAVQEQHVALSQYARVLTGLRRGLVLASQNVSGASLLPGFAVGDTTLVSPHLDAAMIESSLSHLVAVSGANCALITGVMMWLVGVCGGGRHIRTGVALGTLAGFVVLVGPDTSIQRAAIMATITLIGVVTGRSTFALPALGWAIILLLWFDPWQSRQAGFILSVAATAGILLFAPTIHEWCKGRLRLPAAISMTFAVTTAAQIACGPFLLLLQPGVAVGGIVANMVTAPAAPIGTGMGLLAMLFLPWFEGAGTVCVYLGSIATRWVEWVAVTTERLPGTRWYWPEGPMGAALLGCAELAIVLLIAHRKRNPSPPWNLRPRFAPQQTRIQWMLGASGVSVVLMVMIVAPVVIKFTTPRDWFFVACDVGQGDALLIRDPTHRSEVMVIDTGDDPELLRACLQRFDVRDIHTLVLTHDHADHIGALEAVTSVTRQAVIAKPLTGEEDAPRTVTTTLSAANIPHVYGVEGLQGILPGEQNVEWRVLAPQADEHVEDHNPASVVIWAAVRDLHILLLGDTGQQQHEQLRERYEDLQADIVKVAHHGSSDHDPQLLLQLNAQYGVISSGEGNSYGHPSDETLKSLNASKTEALRTDLCGSIALVARETEILAWCEKDPAIQ